MPELNITSMYPNSLPVFAFMCWPNDEQKQRDLLSLDYLSNREYVDTNVFLKDHPFWQSDLEARMRNLGGWDALRSARPAVDVIPDVAKRARRGYWAGGTLCTIYLLQTDHAQELKKALSLRHVWTCLPYSGARIFTDCPSAHVLKDVWDEFLSVAHLWAAWYLVERWMGHGAHSLSSVALPIPKECPYHEWVLQRGADTLRMQSVLTLAKEIQSFGLSFKAPRASKTLLDPDQLWQLQKIPNWPVERPRGVLSQRFLSLFNADKPKRDW